MLSQKQTVAVLRKARQRAHRNGSTPHNRATQTLMDLPDGSDFLFAYSLYTCHKAAADMLCSHRTCGRGAWTTVRLVSPYLPEDEDEDYVRDLARYRLRRSRERLLAQHHRLPEGAVMCWECGITHLVEDPLLYPFHDCSLLTPEEETLADAFEAWGAAGHPDEPKPFTDLDGLLRLLDLRKRRRRLPSYPGEPWEHRFQRRVNKDLIESNHIACPRCLTQRPRTPTDPPSLRMRCSVPCEPFTNPNDYDTTDALNHTEPEPLTP